MKYKECIKKIGLKNVILYEMFYILEIILNLPYLMLRGIAIIYDDILEFIVFITKKQQNLLARIFGKTRIINLSKLSKRIDDFRLKTIKELKKDNEELKKDYYNVINKIENKIDILDIAISECIYIDDDDKAYKKAVKKDKLCLLNQKRALQELLEGGQS